MLLLGAEPHHVLDAGAVVPASGRRSRSPPPPGSAACTAACTSATSRGPTAPAAPPRRKMRGLTRSVIALITPPLPAASRPSKTMMMPQPLVLHPVLEQAQLRPGACAAPSRTSCVSAARGGAPRPPPPEAHGASPSWGRCSWSGRSGARVGRTGAGAIFMTSLSGWLMTTPCSGARADRRRRRTPRTPTCESSPCVDHREPCSAALTQVVSETSRFGPSVGDHARSAPESLDSGARLGAIPSRSLSGRFGLVEQRESSPRRACRLRLLEPNPDRAPRAFLGAVEIPLETRGIGVEHRLRIGRQHLPRAGADLFVELTRAPDHEASEVARIVRHRLDHPVNRRTVEDEHEPRVRGMGSPPPPLPCGVRRAITNSDSGSAGPPK